MIRTMHLSSLLLLLSLIPARGVLAQSQQPLPAEGDEAALIAVLDSDAKLFEKAKACQRLAIIGTAQSVPALAKYLDDETLSHYARYGLEINPAPEADQVLLDATETVQGEQLVGVVNSIGVRRDQQAVKRLGDLAESDDEAVAAAALGALGKLAASEAIEKLRSHLKGSSAVTAADALLTAADRLIREGNNQLAADVLKSVREADLPSHLNVATRFGEIRTANVDVAETMVAYLDSGDEAIFRVGLELAHEIGVPDADKLLIEQMKSAEGERKVLLIHVLGSRGERSALPAVLELTASEDRDTQLAALQVIGRIGNEKVVPSLLEATASEDPQVQTAAKQSLIDLPGEAADGAILESLTAASGSPQLALVEAIGARGLSAAIPQLLKLVDVDEPALGAAAIDALGMTVGLEQLDSMLDLLLEAEAAQTREALAGALQKACQRIADRDQAATILLARAETGSSEAKIALMDLLTYVGGEKAISGAAEAAMSDDLDAADAATRALGRWPSPEVADALLQCAKSGNPAFQVRCLRGYIRIIRQFGLRPAVRLQMSRQAFAAATRDEERKLVLDTLTRFPNRSGMNMAADQLDNQALRDAACKATVAIGEKLVDTDPEIVEKLVPRVLELCGDASLKARAEVLLSRANTE